MHTNPHLAFNGKCEEAFKFYEKAIGGKIGAMMKYGDAPPSAQMSKEMTNHVMHARIAIGDTVLMGADAPPDRYKKPEGIMITLNTDSIAEAEQSFKALSDGASVTMPLQETFFANRFGMVTDKFGIPWMVINQKPM